MNPTRPNPAGADATSGATNAPHVVTINGGSSTIKFAVFAAGEPPARSVTGVVDRIGTAEAALTATGAGGEVIERRAMDVSTHEAAAKQLADWLVEHLGGKELVGVGHRIVHGGVRLVEHQVVTAEVMAELRGATMLDPAHLPREISLLDVLQRRFSGVPQVACFDAAFHRGMPRVAQLLPIPRRYDRAGVRRLGFHGLSYTYLMDELRRVAGGGAADGKVVLAHLGSGASLAAVRGGKPVDTTMGFTPTAGLVMGTRPGDLDPGLLLHLMREEKLDPGQMEQWINSQCGLLGVSETSPDMRDLTRRRDTDVHAAEAVELFCYQARKFVGAFAAALGGLETLVFSGGIGEHSPEVREGICRDLEFLGVHLDPARNAGSAVVISSDDSPVTVRVIRTDEEVVIAQAVYDILKGRTGR